MPGYLLGHPSVNLFRIPDACARADLDGRGKVVISDAVIDEGAAKSSRPHNIVNSQKSTHGFGSKRLLAFDPILPHVRLLSRKATATYTVHGEFISGVRVKNTVGGELFFSLVPYEANPALKASFPIGKCFM